MSALQNIRKGLSSTGSSIIVAVLIFGLVATFGGFLTDPSAPSNSPLKINGKNISDILNLTVDDAINFFNELEEIKISEKLVVLQKVGLGYIKLGQSSSTLSGGEAQRVKLAYFLSVKTTSKNGLFLFDEPTTGLHFDDVNKLLKILHTLVDEGNTVIVIEHNLDVIKTADYIIDLGPLGGVKGGEIIAKGSPEDIANSKKSFTGSFLKKIL